MEKKSQSSPGVSDLASDLGADGSRLPSRPAPAPHSPRRKRDQRVRRFRRELLRVVPELAEARFGPLTQTFARLSILAIEAFDHLRASGLLDESGELRSSVETFQRLANAQLKFATALGLSPAALGKFKREKPVDLAAALADAEVVDDG